MKYPVHAAIIMDGNGRWAKARGLPRVKGHEEGLRTARKVIDYSLARGIKYLSLYVFSTENWKRPQAEVAALFSLAEKYLDDFADFCSKGVRVVVSGEREGLPQKLVRKIEEMQLKTADFDAICVNLCINYGGRREIAHAAQKAAQSGAVNEQSIAANLYNNLPFPDVIVRTGGQKRLSNFMLFQAAYAELYFSDTLWPDFSCEEYQKILEDYCGRSRNFGAITE